MRNILPLVLALLLALPTPLLAQTFKPIADPERFAADAVQAIANGALNEAAKTIAETMGQPTALSTVQNSLQIFSDKKFDFSKKVIDNEIGGATGNHICNPDLS
jgi:hypothetical protein